MPQLGKNEIIRHNVISAIRQWAYLTNLNLPSARHMGLVFRGTCHSSHLTGDGLKCNWHKVFKDVIPSEHKNGKTPNKNIVVELRRKVQEEIDKGAHSFMNLVDSRVFIQKDKDGNEIIPRLKENDFSTNRLDPNSKNLTSELAYLQHLNEVSKCLFDGRYISKIGADVLSDLREHLDELDPVTKVFLLEEYAIRQYAAWRYKDSVEFRTKENKFITQTSDLDMLITLAPWKNLIPPFALPRSNKRSWWDYMVEGGSLEQLRLNVGRSQEPFKLSDRGYRQVPTFVIYNLFNHTTTTSQTQITWEEGHEYAGQPMSWDSICMAAMDWWRNPRTSDIETQIK